jgi:ribosomal protein L11 methyltransferase
LAEVPSGAFGDGSHPTTRLCAGAVDLFCRLNRPAAALDVGTGTGLLARIARARGVSRVVATDLYPVAFEATRVNCALDANCVEIEVSDRAPNAWGPIFDLIVANILEGTLRELAPALARAIRPGGRLFVSGFTPLQIPSVRAVFEAQKFKWEGESLLEGWVMGELASNGIGE